MWRHALMIHRLWIYSDGQECDIPLQLLIKTLVLALYFYDTYISRAHNSISMRSAPFFFFFFPFCISHVKIVSNASSMWAVAVLLLCPVCYGIQPSKPIVFILMRQMRSTCRHTVAELTAYRLDHNSLTLARCDRTLTHTHKHTHTHAYASFEFSFVS